MQRLASADYSSTAATFAGLVAKLAASAKEPAQPWDEDGLADDVASISYEQALRSRRKEISNIPDRAPGKQDFPPLIARATSPVAGRAVSADAATNQAANRSELSPPVNPRHSPRGLSRPAAPARALAIVPERDLKRASITIRMSEIDVMQVRQRAAEAGMTVSAYLRSCTFEVETLRTQVKQVLTELKSAAVLKSQPQPPAPLPPPGNDSPAPRRRRFWPFSRH